MGDNRISAALSRIDAAMSRIEEAADNVPAAEPNTARLVARHEALREAVSGSLAQIDTLIEKLER
ncbi:MAG: hypothetical protein ACR2FJ_06600 [Qipengyuania sp.]